jgi:hypothetical protein
MQAALPNRQNPGGQNQHRHQEDKGQINDKVSHSEKSGCLPTRGGGSNRPVQHTGIVTQPGQMNRQENRADDQRAHEKTLSRKEIRAPKSDQALPPFHVHRFRSLSKAFEKERYAKVEVMGSSALD